MVTKDLTGVKTEAMLRLILSFQDNCASYRYTAAYKSAILRKNINCTEIFTFVLEKRATDLKWKSQ